MMNKQSLTGKAQVCSCTEHRGPEGPNEDMGWCSVANQPTYSMRPENEEIGLHADDCSLPRRHNSYCKGGGKGHPPAEVVRGYWPGMDDDIEAARARHALLDKSSGEIACTCIPVEGHEAEDARGCLRHPILARLDEEAQ